VTKGRENYEGGVADGVFSVWRECRKKKRVSVLYLVRSMGLTIIILI